MAAPTATPTEEQLKGYLDIASTVAREAGALVKSVFDKPRSASTVLDKSIASIDLVTDTDKACEALIFAKLREEFPDFEYLGEESASDEGGYALGDAPTWVVDPIDGTTNFVHRSPEVSAGGTPGQQRALPLPPSFGPHCHST